MTAPVLWVGLILATGLPEGAGRVDYLRAIKPVLARRCYACHGALKQKAGLRLDTAALMRKGGDGGAAIEPGQAAESLLVEAVTGTEGWRMPPEGAPLSAEEIGQIRAWIDQGAASPPESPQPDPRDHWSFRAPGRPEVPRVADRAWSENPIDAFLAAGHERLGLKPVPTAGRAELLRRVALDLTGLAPTPEELRAFLADTSADAYARAVDRLLASPRYGERWGRHWMDVWRYSDWAGYGKEVRESQPHIWHWRDWIVESLNADRGYDRMVVEMLAGDELAPDDPNTLRATGYLARSWYKFNRNSWLQNTVDHSAKAFLGLTLACARCHDHKYDPISQADYYRFRAFFEPHDVRTDRLPGAADTTQDGIARVYDAHLESPTYLFVRGDEKQPDKDRPLAPRLPAILGGDLAVTPVALPRETYYPSLRPSLRAEALARSEQGVSAARAALDRELLSSSRSEPAVAAAQKALEAALWKLEAIRASLAADDARFADPPDSKRAEILAWEAARIERQAAVRQAEAALAAAPAAGPKRAAAARALEAARTAAAKHSGRYTTIAPVYPATSSGRRLALARRIASRDNPLFARVAVNHIWMRHFGRPLVPTVFDLGQNGTPPSHPELLDWLAVEFMDQGYRMKALHRLIVTSRAYQMQSTGGAGNPNAAIDGANAFYWRMEPRRMESEVVRDNVLYVSGRLDLAMGGADLDPAAWMSLPRRSLYFRHAAEKQMLFLTLFDAANVSACYRRDVSVVPQQALALSNSPLALSSARLLAGELAKGLESAPDADPRFVAAAFERVLGRAPTADEAAACTRYLGRQARMLANPKALEPFAAGPACDVAPARDPRQRAREDLVHVLLNHNDFVTIR